MAKWVRPPFVYRIAFKIAKTFGYNVEVSKNPPFMKDKDTTVVYIRRIKK